MNYQELSEIAAEAEKDWSNKVYIHNNCLVLNIRYKYMIDLDRIDTKEKILSWTVHLSEKNWTTREMFFRMFRLLENHFGITFNVPC